MWRLLYKGKIVDISCSFQLLHDIAARYPHWKEEDWEVVPN